MEMYQAHLVKSRKNSTAGKFVFLFIAFPFGLLYFLITVIGLSVGLGTVVIWIGLPLLFVTLAIMHGMAEVERRMVSNLLGIPFPRRPYRPGEENLSFVRRFGNYLRDPLTWTSMIYMLLKLPLGIISFTLVLVLSIVSFAITALPVVYLVNLFVNAILLKNGINSSAILIPYFIEVHGVFDPIMFLRSFIGVPVGLVLWFVSRYVLNGLAQLSGELAYAMLCPVEADGQPSEPRPSAMPSEPQQESERRYYARQA